MIYSKKSLKELTEPFEGLRLKAYQDIGGVWTIGYGHTGEDVEAGLVITQGTAETVLINDIAKAEAAVNSYVTVPLTQNEFDALVDFEFNTGALEKSTMLKLLNAEDYHAAADEFEKWSHVHGQVITGLLHRRIVEEKLFETPIGEDDVSNA